MPLTKEGLKKDAYGSCHDIYKDHTKEEIAGYAASIRGAWDVGRDIALLQAKSTEVKQ